jgi:hypothetical protein
MFTRDKILSTAVRAYIKTALRDDPKALFKNLHRIGSGTYNDVFSLNLTIPPSGMVGVVIRLSYYDGQVLRDALKSVDGQVFLQRRRARLSEEALKMASRCNRADPVKVKNNYSVFYRSLIEHNVSPHFVYIYHYTDHRNFAEGVKHLLPEKRLSQPQQEFTNVSFHELFTTNLHHALVHKLLSSTADVRSIVFQVVYSLAAMQHYLPGFRHNDMSTSNILLKMAPSAAASEANAPSGGAPTAPWYEYEVAGMRFHVPDRGVFAAVWDFDLAHAPGRCTRLDHHTDRNNGEGLNLRNYLLLNSRFSTYKKDLSVRNINAMPNASFDMYFFLNSLRKSLRGNAALRPVLQFAKSLLGADAAGGKEGGDLPTYAGAHDAALDPVNVLRHSFFDELRARADDASGSGSGSGMAPAAAAYSFREIPLRFVCEEGAEVASPARTEYVSPDDVRREPVPGTEYVYSRKLVSAG